MNHWTQFASTAAGGADPTLELLIGAGVFVVVAVAIPLIARTRGDRGRELMLLGLITGFLLGAVATIAAGAIADHAAATAVTHEAPDPGGVTSTATPPPGTAPAGDGG